MRLSCSDALRYVLEGEQCRRIAAREALTLPGSEPKDLLQTAAAKLLRRLRADCPAWTGCPARDGGSTTSCMVPPERTPSEDGWSGPPPKNDGAAFLRQSLRYAIRNERESGRRRLRLDGRALPAKLDFPVFSSDLEAVRHLDRSLLFADTAPPVPDAALAALLMARVAHDVDRIGDGEAPEQVWPGVTDVRLELKVEAAGLVLQGAADDVRHALRTVAPGFYGEPVTRGRRAPALRQRAARDGVDVQAICRSVWERETEGDEG